MKNELQRALLAGAFPLFLLLVLYLLKFLEVGMDWDFTRLGVYPLERRGVFGIFAHPLVHSSWHHLFANTLPLFLLSWALFYFYRPIASYIFFYIWIVCGALMFCIAHPAWHVGASGIIYGLAFFLFFSGVLRRHAPLVALSLLVTFLYGGLVWNMFPQFVRPTTSWEGHLSGAIAGITASVLFIHRGPQRPQLEDSDDDDANGEYEYSDEDDSRAREINNVYLPARLPSPCNILQKTCSKTHL